MKQEKDSDDFVSRLVRQLGMLMRREAAESLLVGNDMGCFSTEQYETAYVLRSRRGQVTVDVEYEKKSLSELIGMDWARQMLLSIPNTVKEVKPDIWTYP